MLTPSASRIREVGDMEKIWLNKTGLNFLSDLDTLSEEELAEATFQFCVLRDSTSETNFTRQLRGMGIPYEVNRFDRIDQATGKYIEGGCEAIVASKSVLASERSTLGEPQWALDCKCQREADRMESASSRRIESHRRKPTQAGIHGPAHRSYPILWRHYGRDRTGRHPIGNQRTVRCCPSSGSQWRPAFAPGHFAPGAQGDHPPAHWHLSELDERYQPGHRHWFPGYVQRRLYHDEPIRSGLANDDPDDVGLLVNQPGLLIDPELVQ